MDSRLSAAKSFMRLTRSVSFASVDSILPPLLGSPQKRADSRNLYTQNPAKKLRLPTAAGAAAARTATAKTTETSASTTRTAAGTSAKATTTAEHATDHGADPPTATSSAAA